MNVVIAHLKKDFVPLRGLLIAMLLILSSAVALRVMTALGLPISIRGNLGGLIQTVILSALIVRVIHQDSLTDVQEFWRTRPISRRQLLLAKGAFLVLPALAALIVGRPWESASTEVDGNKILELGIFLAGLAAFASVTSSFSKMIRLAIKVMIVGLLFTMLLALALTVLLLPWAQLATATMSTIAGAGISPTALSVATSLATIAGFLGIVVYQYLTLKTETSVRAIFGLCVVGSLISSLATNLPR